MRTFIIKPGDLIPIGRAGENQATQIRFDVTGWADTFGAGTYTLVVKRPHEDTAYPVEVATDGDYVVWTVSNVDTGIAGNASVQLRYVVDGALAKSVIYAGIVGESLDNIVDPPDPFEDLIQRMVDLTERTEAAAESAAGSAASASESAGTATAAKTAAQTAAQAAQTAQGTATQAAQTATQAKDAAQAAQQAAEAAKAAAAQSATAASGSATAAAGSATQAAASATAADASAAAAAQSAAAAQAAAMDVIDKAPIITDTASGSIASFPDGSAAPIKQLAVAVNPVQDLHGYDNPWPAGGGKNKAGLWKNAYIDSSGNVVSNSNNGLCYPVFVASGNSVTLSKGTFTQYGYAVFSGFDGTTLSTMLSRIGSITLNTTTFTATQDCYFAAWYNYTNTVWQITLDEKHAQIELGSSATAFAPYSNICPITGWTGAIITRTGKNLFDKDHPHVYNGYIDVSTSKQVYSASHKTVYIPCKPNTTYTLQKVAVNSGTSDRLYVGWSETIPAYQGTQVYGLQGKGSGFVAGNLYSFSVTTGATAKYLVCWLSRATEYGASLQTFQIEVGAIATAYESYTGTTYPITFPSESGTVYGGTVTVNQDGTGTLVATHSLFTVTSFAGVWGATSNGYAVYATISGTFRTIAARSNWFKYNGNGYTTMPVWTFCGGSGAQGTVSFVLPSTITSKAEANAWLAALDTPLTVYIKLATPVTYTLTAAEMSTLFGQNNWWADTGNVTVNYRADTKLYIDKKLAALLAALS